jgi:hypothetical protein
VQQGSGSLDLQHQAPTGQLDSNEGLQQRGQQRDIQQQQQQQQWEQQQGQEAHVHKHYMAASEGLHVFAERVWPPERRAQRLSYALLNVLYDVSEHWVHDGIDQLGHAERPSLVGVNSCVDVSE